MKVDGTLEKLRVRMDGLRDFEGLRAKVGWLPSAHYADGTPVASVAIVQEFGSAVHRIPARPFIRTTFAEQKGNWANLLLSSAKQVEAGSLGAQQVLEGVGLQAAGDIRKKITQIWHPPLAESTVEARAARTASGKVTPSLTKPLVDTGHMLATCTSEVAHR